MTLDDRFCKMDYSRLELVNVAPEIRIRQGDTYVCRICNQNYSEVDTITEQQKRAILEDDQRQNLLGFDTNTREVES